ncbi:hypothetical protein ACTZWW_04985 [Salinarimonas sp. NSM]|uniref:hypothetical protein n=1 Tax=Salinarimonas sp. NSM TaxID=3458003 RepID=UPI0040370CE2
MKGLTIRDPWIDLILDGLKTWELRTSATANRGPIALVRKGSGLIEGVATLVDVLPPLDRRGLAESEELHRIPPEEQENAIANGWLTPWVFVDPIRFAEPVPYLHPNGAVIFFDLAEEERAGVERARRRPGARGPLAMPAEKAEPAATARAIPRPEPGTLPPQSRGKGKSPQISPELEALLVRVAQAESFDVKPLESAQTKMLRLSVRRGGTTHYVFIDRMPASEPEFRVFLEPSVDTRIESALSGFSAVRRFVNARGGGHAFRHSAFRAFAEMENGQEPAAHGWMVRSREAGSTFPLILRAVAGT